VHAVPDEPDMSLVEAVAFDDVRAAAQRLDGVARRTPVITSRTLNARTGAEVFLKCESFQRVGAFKFRGAYNALGRLPDDQRARGVLTYSSGNHAQAVALSASLLAVPALIIMPADAPPNKLAATRAYLQSVPPRPTGPSQVVTYDRASQVRERLGLELAERDGLTIIPPYDHPHVIAGQGTVGLELIKEIGELDALYCCCGGGGLMTGCATAARELSPRCRVIGVEPETADDAARSFRDRRLHRVHEPETIADGARTPSLGRYTFPLMLDRVSEMMTVADTELAAAMRFCFERLKLVVEPTGALALAGLLRAAELDPASVRGTRLGVVITGGNVDRARFCALLDEGRA